MARSTPASSFLATSLALGVLVLAGGSASGSAAGDVRAAASTRAKNAIQRENARAGTRAWSLDPTATKGQILGYASEVSVLPRETVHFHVSTTPAARYQIVLYRLGWYRGRALAGSLAFLGARAAGAGRRKWCLLPTRRPGSSAPGGRSPTRTGSPLGAVSGYFLAKLQLISGPQDGKVSYVPLILRAPATRRSKILVQGSVNSWQASNAWGGKSLYAFNSTDNIPANHVSFERPYDPEGAVPITAEIGPSDFSSDGLRRLVHNEHRHRPGAGGTQAPSAGDLLGPRPVLDQGNPRRVRGGA